LCFYFSSFSIYIFLSFYIFHSLYYYYYYYYYYFFIRERERKRKILKSILEIEELKIEKVIEEKTAPKRLNVEPNLNINLKSLFR
jgi:hypothetical protein